MIKKYMLFFALTVILGVYEQDLTFSAVMLIFGIAALFERLAKRERKKTEKNQKFNQRRRSSAQSLKRSA